MASSSQESSWGSGFKTIMLMVYIVLSALFIAWVGYRFFSNTVFGTGMQQWYERAILDVANQSLTEQACQSGVPLNIGNGQTTTIINTQCFQQPEQNTQPQPQEQVEQGQ